MKNTLIAVCALLAMAATAGADTYYNGPYDEGAGTNVINSFVELSSPTFIGRLSPGITNSVLVTSAGTLEQTDKLYVGYSNVADGTTGLLKVQGTMTSASGTAIFGWGAGGVGTLEIDGGNVTMAALSTGRDGSTGVVTINGGSLTVNGATFGYGREGNTNTMVTQTGGAVDINGDVRLGLDAGTATYSISGGSLEMNGMYLGKDGTGRFDVVGSSAGTIALNGTLSLVSGYNLWVGSKATFGFTVDAGGVTSIAAGNARLDGGVIDMAIADGVTVANNTTLTLLTIDAAVQGSMNNLSLAAGDEYVEGVQSGWTLQNDGSTRLRQFTFAATARRNHCLTGLAAVNRIHSIKLLSRCNLWRKGI